MVRALLLLVPLAAACGDSSDGYRVTIDLGPAIRSLASDDLDESSSAADRIAAEGPDSLPALETALRTEPAPIRRQVAAVAGQIEGPRATRLLVTAATDPDVDVRYEAIVALGARAAPETRDTVESALADRDPKVRLAAAGACATLCASPTALARLVDLAVRDQPLPNALAARSSIVRILADADTERADRLRAAVRSEAFPVLARPGEGDEGVRAALLASDVGDAAGRDLLAAAAVGGTAPALRLQAIHALGTIGDADAVPVLAKIDGQPTFGEYACDALRRLAGRDVRGARAALDGWRGACPVAALPPPPGAR